MSTHDLTVNSFDNSSSHKEQILWEGTPSQLVNIKPFFNCFVLCLVILCYVFFSEQWILLCALIIPLTLMFWVWLSVSQTKYILTNERFVKNYGIFTKHTFDIELYRVKDVQLKEPLLMRFFKLGTLLLLTSQQSTSFFKVPGVSLSRDLREKVRHCVEQRRNDKGVREFDTN